MGVAVVGILGNTTASRMGCSIVWTLGRAEWITSTLEAFAEVAAELLRDLVRLGVGRHQMRHVVLASPLFTYVSSANSKPTLC